MQETGNMLLWTWIASTFLLPLVFAYFGLSSPQRLPTSLAGPLSCASFNLVSRQMDECGKGGLNVQRILTEALWQSAVVCQQQFRYERWNCTLTDGSRRRILQRAFSETAFLFAVSSAALVHSFARGCSSGALPLCSCDVSEDPRRNRETWTWGSCGDNLRYAQRYVRRFLFQASTAGPRTPVVVVHAARKGSRTAKKTPASSLSSPKTTRRTRPKPRDLRSQVHKHNAVAGIKATMASIRVTCKCHGVSGSCTTKTCWQKLPDFDEIGATLKQQYDSAILHRLDDAQAINRGNRPAAGSTVGVVTETTSGGRNGAQTKEKNRNRKRKNGKLKSNKKRSRKNLSVTFSKMDGKLVYLDRSPSFCSSSNYSSGTRGRHCANAVNCDSLCCERGYAVSLQTRSLSCCRFNWCCSTKCEECLKEEKVFVCN